MSKKGGCCGAGGRRRKTYKKRRGGSVVADALVTVGALAAWKYLGKKKGGGSSKGTRKLPMRHGLTGRRSLAR